MLDEETQQPEDLNDSEEMAEDTTEESGENSEGEQSEGEQNCRTYRYGVVSCKV